MKLDKAIIFGDGLESSRDECCAPIRIYGGALQQLWKVISYKGSKPVGLSYEWRPIPVVDVIDHNPG